MIAFEDAGGSIDRNGWVGRVPESWAVGPLRRFCKITLGKMVATEAGDGVETQPYLRAAHVQPRGVLALVDIKEMPFTSDEARKLTLEADDVVVVEGGAGFGRSAVLRDSLTGWGFQNSINRVRPLKGSGRFTNYALLAAQGSGYFQTLINTATIPHLTAEKLAEVQIAWPNEGLQGQIVDYLDAQTSKIDLLIEKQETLIDTLTERRQAVISHAVSKGLDSTTAMTDSGVDWFGAVPRNWRVVPIKRLMLLITDGAHISPELEGGEYDFVSTRDVSLGIIDFEGALKTSPASYEYLLRMGCQPQLGDVLFSKDGTVGRTVVVNEIRRFVVASSLIILRPDADQLFSSFFNYLCQSVQIQEQVRWASTTSTGSKTSWRHT